jgi:pimeloyl-ACP methyl ester carboxylesterase
MTTIYLFGGLGTDERVFQYIDFSEFSVHYIQWVAPQKGEAIHAYAQRLSGQIHFEKPVFIGVSFGGIMAVEVAKIIATEKIILISSAKTKYEIPFYYRIAGMLRLHTLLPPRLLKHPNSFVYWLFGIKNKKDKKLLAAILCDTDEHFLTWAIDTIVTWKNNYQHSNLIHLHGNTDKILPYYFTRNAIAIEGGGHFMIVDKAKLLTAMLRNILAPSNIQS